MYFTLFLCRCPIRCHSRFFGSSSYLVQSSCTLFSPNIVCPASIASSIMEIGLVLLTAIRVTSLGSRPLFSQAFLISSRTFCNCSATIHHSPLFRYVIFLFKQNIVFIYGISVSDNIIKLGKSIGCPCLNYTIFIILLNHDDFPENCISFVDTVDTF